jgi:hypothetical protein
MPLPRLNSRINKDGTVPIGAMRSRIKLEQLNNLEVWAKVSALGRKATITLHQVPDLRSNMFLISGDRRFRIERVMELGTGIQMQLECAEV